MTAASFAGLPVFPNARIDALASEIPAVFHDKELVLDTTRCRQLVHQLKKELIIGISGEGIRLGKHGPLTLFQIGTFYGKVYIFDVLVNNELFDKGGLRQLLESMDIKKVTHTVCHLSAALHYQFSVRLRNVFDTQVAHLIIERDKGRLIPNRISLSAICQMYSENGHPYDWRSDIKEMWMMRIGDYWSQRPLSDEMVEYAAGDVMAIIPDVFRNQLEYMEGHSLLKTFREMMEEEIVLESNVVIQEIRGKRIEQDVKDILHHVDEKYEETCFLETFGDDEINSLRLVTFEDAQEISPKIQKFKVELILDELHTIENDLHLNQDVVRGLPNLDSDLREYELHPEPRIRLKAKAIRADLYKEILRSIGQRYSGLVSPEILSETERQALRSLNPTSECDSNFDPDVLALHWLVVDQDLEEALFTLKYDLSDHVISDEFIARVIGYVNMPVAEGLKQKCKIMVKYLERRKQRETSFIEKRVTFQQIS